VQFKAKANDDKSAGTKQNFVFVPTAALRDKDGRNLCCSLLTARLCGAMFTFRASVRAGYLVDSLVGGENVITAGPRI